MIKPSIKSYALILFLKLYKVNYKYKGILVKIIALSHFERTKNLIIIFYIIFNAIFFISIV